MNGTNGNTNGNSIIKLQTNIPAVIALKFQTGLEVQSKNPTWANQVMFTTVDDRRIYLSVASAQAISSLGVKPGEPIQVCRQEVREGQRRYTREVVSRVGQQQQPAAAQPTPSEPDYMSALEKSIQEADERKAQRQQEVSPDSPATVPAPSAVATQQNRQPQITTKKEPGKIPYDRALTHFLIVAGRAARRAEQVLGLEGGSVRFDSRDIAALATTITIEAFKRDRLTSDGYDGGVE